MLAPGRPEGDSTTYLRLINLRCGSSPSLADLATRSMDLRFTVQERQIWITDGAATVEVEPALLTAPGHG